MARKNIKVDFGFEMPEETVKGTLIVMDSFEQSTEEEVKRLFDLADKRGFDKVIFYPYHENTLKRMGFDGVRPYFKRIKYLREIIDEVNNRYIPFTIDEWEGKRKKYTPIETSMNFLKEKNKGPYFLCVKSDIANKIIHYHSFENMIKDTRLMIDLHYTETLDPKYQKYKNRWELVDKIN